VQRCSDALGPRKTLHRRVPHSVYRAQANRKPGLRLVACAAAETHMTMIIDQFCTNVHEFLSELLTKASPPVKVGAPSAPKSDVGVNDKFGGVSR
jgi:hypothetical protein